MMSAHKRARWHDVLLVEREQGTSRVWRVPTGAAAWLDTVDWARFGRSSGHTPDHTRDTAGSARIGRVGRTAGTVAGTARHPHIARSEEHTSELQSRRDL